MRIERRQGKAKRGPLIDRPANGEISPILSVSRLVVNYGQVEAVRGIDFEVGVGEAVCILGSNGAGKSSTLNTIQGLVRVAAGTIRFRARDISNLAIENRVRDGLALCPEGRKLFAKLSVEENLRLAGTGLPSDVVQGRIDRAAELFPMIAGKMHTGASFLSGGQQQQVAIARALMRDPDLLMLDEPSLGLDPKMTNVVFDAIARLRDEEDLSILLVEQNADRALDLCDRGYVLDTGQVKLAGKASDLDLGEIERTYLGLYVDEAESRER